MTPLYQLLCALLVIINAQNEEMFYYYDFEYQLDWIQYTGSTSSVQWRVANNCPRIVAGETSSDAWLCLHTTSYGSISRIISTVGFHSIHLQIDAKASSVDIGENEWCIIQYKTAATNWINTNIVQDNDYELGFDVFIPDNDVYNNQESFEVKIGIDADAGGDNCFFDNLKLFGIPSTETPTLDTNHPTQNPSRSPLVETTLYPTKYPTKHPTSHPILEPTLYPSNVPISQPTSYPTLLPSVNPTFSPTFSPLYVPITSLIAQTAAVLSESTQNTFRFTEDSEDYVFETNDDTFITIVIVFIVTIISLAMLCIICIVVRHCKGSKQRNKMYAINRNIAMNNMGAINRKANNNHGHILRESMDEEPKINKVNVDTETNDELRLWLTNIVQLPQYYSCFVDHGYDDLASLKNCIEDKSELEAIGIKLIGHKTRILTSIKLLQNETTSNYATNGTVATNGEMVGDTDIDGEKQTNGRQDEGVIDLEGERGSVENE